MVRLRTCRRCKASLSYTPIGVGVCHGRGGGAGVPVCALFGGPIRTELEVYWSHCGSFRVRAPRRRAATCWRHD